MPEVFFGVAQKLISTKGLSLFLKRSFPREDKGIMSGLSVDRGGILKLLWSLGIDSKELIAPASYAAWWARFLAPINCSKILAQISLPGWAMHGLFFTFQRIKENLRNNIKVAFVIPT